MNDPLKMHTKNLLRLLIVIVLFNLIFALTIGDVSILSYKHYLLKKRIIGPSVRPFLNEQYVTTKIKRTRSILELTTPISRVTTTPKSITFVPIRPIYDQDQPKYQLNNEFDFKNDTRPSDKNNLNRINNEREKIDEKKFNLQSVDSLSDPEMDVITYPPISLDENRIDSDDKVKIFKNKYIDYGNLIQNRDQFKDKNSDYSRNQNNNENLRNQFENVYKEEERLNQPNNPSHYKTVIVNRPNVYIINKKKYPAIKFLNQYKCDINVTTCGLENEPLLSNMFYLEHIQDTNRKQRCFVADTMTAKQKEMVGARLITQYFHTFGLLDACFEIEYFANGYGIVKMEIAQQDETTERIWYLNNFGYDGDLNFLKIKSNKIPIKLKRSDPRFFITVQLNPNKIGRVGLLGFNFTYSRCDQL